MRAPSAQPRSGAAPAAVPEGGIVTDQPRKPAQPALRAEVKTQDEVEIATLRGKVAFFEEENRKLQTRIKSEVEAAGHQGATSARADAEKIRGLLKQREDEIKRIQKELDEKETYYSPAELERERKRMEAAIEAERRRENETLQRQIKELEHRVAIRGAESETVARQLKEKDDLIKMLSEREDESQGEIKARDEKITSVHDEMKALRDAANSAAGKEKELNDKVKQKNTQLAQLGKERGELVQELAKARTILAKVGGAEEAAAAVEEQERATRTMQDQINKLEADFSRAKDDMSALTGRLTSSEAEKNDLKKQVQETEAQMTDAMDARMKVESQLSDILRKSGDRDQHEKQLSMLKADRDARATEARTASEAQQQAEAQLAKIRGTYEDIIAERDTLKAKVEALESEGRMAATGSQLSADWEARYKSANDQIGELKLQLSKLKIELSQAKELAAKGGASGGSTVSEGKLTLVAARGELHVGLVAQMLEGVNNSVSLLRRNSELMRGYVEDCGLLANAIRRVDYTRLEPDQQQMLVELIDQTQPDVIVKNMQGISEENTESIVKAKKLILDYSDAFKKEDHPGIEIESALARAQALFHATNPSAEIAVKIEAVMPSVEGDKDEAVLFAFALLREAQQFALEEGAPPAVLVGTDGLTVTFTASPVDAKMKDRYRDPPDAQSRLVRGFAVDRCSGKIDFREDDGKTSMVVTLKAKL
jgi:myosin heavy subunit